MTNKTANGINDTVPNVNAFESKVFKNFKNLQIRFLGVTRTCRRICRIWKESEREHDKRPEIRNDKGMWEDWPGWRRRSILKGSENYSQISQEEPDFGEP